MKDVRAVLDPPSGDAAEPGIWLPLAVLIELPFALSIRVQLLRWLVAQLECDVQRVAGRPAGVPAAESSVRHDACVVLLAALVAAELSHASHQLEGGAWQEGRSSWQAALEHHHQVQQLQPDALGSAQLMDGLIQSLARLDQALTHRQWRPPTSPLENAQVHADAAALLHQIRELQQPLPGWFAVVEEGLLRRGAIALLQQSAGCCRREGVALLLRHSRLHPPAPDGLAARLDLAVLGLLEDLEQSSQPVADLQALLEALSGLGGLELHDDTRRAAIQEALTFARGCLELAAEARQPQGLRAADGPAPGAALEPAQIAELVGDWLADQPLSGAPITVELIWIPGARAVPHGPGQLAFNLAALPPGSHADPTRLERLLSALLEPLQSSGTRQGWQLRPACASLLASLRQLWRGGGALTWHDCQLVAEAQAQWQAPADAALPEARLAAGCCVVQPSAPQLAALRCWLLEREQLEPALAQIRRQHHDAAFMRLQAAGAGAAADGDVLQSLCALHVQEGFYASATAAMASFEAWANGSLQQLGKAQLLVNPRGSSSSWWAVLQGVIQHLDHLPELVIWPAEERFYDLLAGEEVVLISPMATLVEEQHRSGRAFALFHDLEIAPYGLRTLAPPASLYPERPHRSFEASLSACLEAVDALARARRFSVFLSVAGAYDLPLCRAVNERYGASCLAIGAGLHARFGIEDPSSAGWRSEQRRADRWRRIC